MAKLTAEHMLKKDVIVNAKASAPDFWGVNGDFVSLLIESYLLADFGSLYLFSPSPDWGCFLVRMLLRLTGFFVRETSLQNNWFLYFDVSTVKLWQNCVSYGKDFLLKYVLIAENTFVAGTVNQDIYSLPICWWLWKVSTRK